MASIHVRISASVLLGAVNIEQTKFLNWQDLELLLGTVVRFPAPQRELLKTIATDATVEALFRFNPQGRMVQVAILTEDRTRGPRRSFA